VRDWGELAQATATRLRLSAGGSPSSSYACASSPQSQSTLLAGMREFTSLPVNIVK